MMTLREQITADQADVFFDLDDFAVTAVVNGEPMTVIMHDLGMDDSADVPGNPVDGVLLNRRRLRIKPDDIDWTPVAGMEIDVDDHTWMVEHVGGGPRGDDFGSEPWALLLVRYAS